MAVLVSCDTIQWMVCVVPYLTQMNKKHEIHHIPQFSRWGILFCLFDYYRSITYIISYGQDERNHHGVTQTGTNRSGQIPPVNINRIAKTVTMYFMMIATTMDISHLISISIRTNVLLLLAIYQLFPVIL